MNTYIYDGTFKGLVCVAVKIFKTKEYADRVFSDSEEYQQVLFDEEIFIDTDAELADRGIKFMGKDAETFFLSHLFDTASHNHHIANAMSRYFRDKNYIERFDEEDVREVFKYAKKTSSECHRMKEFIRFEELKDSVFYSEISPDADILKMLAEHFNQRMPSDKWMIFDSSRKKLLCRTDGETSFFENAELDGAVEFSSREEKFQSLWKIFFENISIKERENLKLQTQHVPARYKKHMTEFK